ncbi:ImuA family protein [Rhodobacter ferrooxidans]|uniref:Protein ImuA n=1 Tax=Rhodobacter ferrooxidans TaxID=371731 RepID=C8S043_9RHOB|nr:hypothetical protein [Rhodobacter sp. SW2]EEW25652.1 conserved hypothetical protein [Rhodobacter sp. SW2]
MPTQLAPLHGPKARPMQPLPGGLALLRGRVHEFCGMARRSLAALLLAESSGPVLWISPGWQPERLFPDGLRHFADPGRLIFAQARRPEDLLWAAEESLRSGAVPLVVVDLLTPPGLTPVRRLHLAAETGAEAAHHAGRAAPLGILMTPGNGGAQGVESRWQLTSVLTADPGLSGAATTGAWQLTRLRARLEPPAAWTLLRDRAGRCGLEPRPGGLG